MISAQHICTICNFVYEAPEERTVDGITINVQFDKLSPTWRCPNCDAGKEFFRPCGRAILPFGHGSEWAHISLIDLVNQIESTHHAYLKGQSSHLSSYISRIAALHGDSHPELKEVSVIFDNLRTKLNYHIKFEEERIFALCREFVRIESLATRPVDLQKTLRELQSHHKEFSDSMGKIRLLLNNYLPPGDACPSYCTLLAQLSEFGRNLRIHGTKERFILYPGLRAIFDEPSMKAGA